MTRLMYITKHQNMRPSSSHRSNSQTTLFSSLSIFQIWSYILQIQNFSLSAPNFKETLIAAIKQGETAKAAIGSVIKTINSITNYSLFLVAKWFPQGEIAKESNITSIPVYRDAPRNETNRRYFEFKRYKIYERFKISIHFHFSCIVYLPRTLLTYQFRKLLLRRHRPLNFTESLLLHYNKTP